MPKGQMPSDSKGSSPKAGAAALPTLAGVISKLEERRKSRVLVLAPKGMITAPVVDQVHAILEKERPERLDLLVHSGGGIPGPAYRLARHCQHYSKTFTALVPRRAKSAATMVCLGASSIVFGSGAELGPLDTQLGDPADPDEMISALEGFKGLEAVSSFCHQFLDSSMLLIIERTHYKVKDTLQLATSFAAPVLRPLFEQIDPRGLGRFKRALEIAQFYSERLLQHAGVDEAAAGEIVQRLVYDYPSHDFVIELSEAKEIGLPVEAADPVDDALMRLAVALLPANGYVGCPQQPSKPVATVVDAAPVATENKPQADADAKPADVNPADSTSADAPVPSAKDLTDANQAPTPTALA